MTEASPLRILHLEDDGSDIRLIQRALAGLRCEIYGVDTRAGYIAALEGASYDLVMSDTGIPGFDGLSALELAHQRTPRIPFIFVSGQPWDERDVQRLKLAGAADCVSKSRLDQLAPAVQRALRSAGGDDPEVRNMRYLEGMERLIAVVQELSLARDLPTVMAIVRRAARELTGADGATFVLRDRDMCFYAEENAIAPLWKGRRFPLEHCISGWAMLNRRQVVVEDIYADARIPHDAYRPTFVKSLAMVPIRTMDPIGAIGNYWATRRRPAEQEVKLLQALADTTAVAMENVRIYGELERRVKDRTAELQTLNKELEAFSSAVSHDLRAPLRHIDGFAQLLVEDCAPALGEKGVKYLGHIGGAARRMSQLIEDLLALSRTAQIPMIREKIDIGLIALEVAAELQAAQVADGGRKVEFAISQRLAAQGDPRLMRIALENLLSNALKFSSKKAAPRIEVGSGPVDGETAWFVRDNGAGFDMAAAGRLFGVFQRLHSENDFPGTGVGLATVQRIVRKHGGRIWAESEPGQGATFWFTLG